MSDIPVVAKLLTLRLEALRAAGVMALPAPRQGHPERVPPLRRDESRDGERSTALHAVEREVAACTRCPLYRTRTHHVFGDGDPHASLVFVGEAPGREEDLQGRPFVGAAGQLLTKMIEAMGLRREQVYICNVLKDRPPGNRLPEPAEMEACVPYLAQQLAIIQPKVICVLGATAAKALIGPHVAITKIRGSVLDYRGIRLVPTFHPAYLLRNPPAKRVVWQDLKRVKQLLAQ